MTDDEDSDAARERRRVLWLLDEVIQAATSMKTARGVRDLLNDLRDDVDTGTRPLPWVAETE